MIVYKENTYIKIQLNVFVSIKHYLEVITISNMNFIRQHEKIMVLAATKEAICVVMDFNEGKIFVKIVNNVKVQSVYVEQVSMAIVNI